MKMTHKEYLERKLNSLKAESKQLNINHRINIAVYNAKNEMIEREISAIESQLKDSDE